MDTSVPLTAETITSRVPGYPESPEARHRAFERDKDELRSWGLTLVQAVPPGSESPAPGYFIPAEQNQLGDIGLSDDELAALHLANSVVRVPGTDPGEGLWKLGGVVPHKISSLDELDVAVPATDDVVALFAALADRVTASFRYNDTERTVVPAGLAFRGGHWYLKAHIVQGSDGDILTANPTSTTFRVDRMETAVVLGTVQVPRPPVPTDANPSQPWEFGGEPPETFVLKIAADVESALSAQLTSAEWTRHDDGTATVRVNATRWEPLRSMVLRSLGRITVVEPTWAVDDIVAWLDGIVK